MIALILYSLAQVEAFLTTVCWHCIEGVLVPLIEQIEILVTEKIK